MTGSQNTRGKRMPPCLNWSRPLPRPLTIPTVMNPVTLADVRTLIGHLPKETRARDTWQHVEAELKKAAGVGDTASVSVSLRVGIITNEGIESTT
jgi:hypothetical protein